VLPVALPGEALLREPAGKGLGAVEDRTQFVDLRVDFSFVRLDPFPLRRLAHDLLLDHEVHGLAAQPIEQRHLEAARADGDHLRAPVLLVEGGEALIADRNAVDPYRVTGVDPLGKGPCVHEQDGHCGGPARDPPHRSSLVPALDPSFAAGAGIPIRLANGRSVYFTFCDRDPTYR
jgi:hypothetical protein